MFKEFFKWCAVGESVVYILGHKEFYGCSFEVGSGVLVLRSEMEYLVDVVVVYLVVVELVESCIVDVGTGSGAIVIILVCECFGVIVVVIDILI